MKKFAALLLAAGVLPLLAAGGGKLNDAERAYLVDQLEQSKKAMLASIQGLSDAQWRFKPAPAVWSVQECAEHIILAEDFIFALSQQVLQSPAVERPANSNPEFDRGLVAKLRDRSQKAHAPEPLVPSERFATPADAAREFTLRRDKTLAYAKSTTADLRVHVGSTPIGTIDSYQVLLLLAAHSARHTAQIREVEGNTGYPKTAAAGHRYLVSYALANVTLDHLTPQQMAKLQEHGAYLKSQIQKGVILWGGRTTDATHPHGFIEIAVGSEAEAQAWANHDPSVQAGIFQCTVEAFDDLSGMMHI